MPQAWSEDEVNILKKLSEKYHISKIAEKMGKTENAIYLKAKKLDITLIQDRRKWTKEEEEILEELWGYQSIESIAKKLKRTTMSLKEKAVKMKLGPMIKNNCDILTISDISELLNVSYDRIINTWIKLGLNLKKKRLTKKRTYYVITIEDLMNFLEKNQNEWDSRNLELNILGIEPEWLREKRLRDIDENPLWYRKWTEDDKKIAESLFQMGMRYEDIAKKLQRSKYAVMELLNDRGYSYKLPEFWKGKEIKFLRENYMKMTHAEIAEELGRNKIGVKCKASELGFQKIKSKDTK